MIRLILRIILRAVLALRYKIEAKGLDTLSRGEGVFFLANHPSEVDPVVLLTLLGEKFKPRPIVVETVYEMKFLKPFMKLIRAISIPDFDLGGNEYVKLLAKKAINEVIAAFNRGENILLYPSGRLKRGAREEVKGVSGAFDIVKQAPQAKIVLVRTEGLWGSLFSLARTESSQYLLSCLLKAAWLIIKNLIFFLPRRKVVVEFYEAPGDFYTYSSKEGFNKALEDWFNKPFGPEGEPLSLVPESFWSNKLPKLLKREIKERSFVGEIPERIKAQVIAEIGRIVRKNPNAIALDHSLSNDVGLDSLDVITLIAFLENEYGIKHLVPSDLQTVLDAVGLAAHKVQPHEEPIPFSKWPEAFKHKKEPSFEEGETLIEVFLNTAAARFSDPAFADLMTGRILSYGKARIAVILLSEEFKKFPEKHVAVMLPAVSGAYMTVLALMLAGKTPVMLNWTLGHYMINEAAKISGIKTIITAKKFVRFAKSMDIEGFEDQLLFLEDLSLNFLGKAKAWFKRKKKARELLPPGINGESTAVFLFTSGSEAKPKGVPLTHHNILSNQRSAFDRVEFRKSDVLLGFLPPFHSFGFSVTGLFPLMCGLTVVYAPDPTDSHHLAEALDRWRVTFVCGAPPFLRPLIQALQPGEGQFVRLVVTGAEKAPRAFFDQVEQKLPKAEILEGYGATECAPVLTINFSDRKGKGVGKALPGVELAVSDLEKTKLLGPKEVGLILANGPNVFGGYLGQASSPFVTLDGKTWYVTGDLGTLDEEGFLTLAGRLKRFVKIGGEMINLLSIEEILTESIGVEERPYLAIIAKEEKDRPELILFTTKSLSLEEVNNIIRQKRMSHLAKLSDVIHIDELPLLGTGKVNTRLLQEKLTK